MVCNHSKHITAFIIALLSLSLNAQNDRILSLEQLLPELNSDTAIVNTLNALSYEYYRLDIEKTLYYGEKALEQSRAIQYQKGISQALNYLAIAYSVQNDHQTALAYNESALTIARALNDSLLIGNALNDMGISYQEINLIDKALIAYLDAARHYENTDSPIKIYNLENIAWLYWTLGDEEKVEEYEQRVRALAVLSDDPNIQYYDAYYKAGDFMELEMYDSAKYYYQEALSKSVSLTTKSDILSQLGSLNAKTGSLPKAKKQALQAVALLEESGNKDLILGAVMNYSEILLEAKEYKECLIFLQSYLKGDLEDYNYFTDLEYACQLQAEAYLGLGMYAEASACLKKQLSFRDSIANNTRIKTVANLEAQNKIQKKEEENSYLRTQQRQNEIILEQRQQVNLYMAIMTALLLAVIILLLRFQRNNKQFNERLQEEVAAKTRKLQDANKGLMLSNAELERFAYITSHDLREPLRNISGFSTLISRTLELPKGNDKLIREYLNFIRNSTIQMDQLIKSILEYSRLETVQVKDENVAVGGILEEVEQSLLLMIEERGATIKTTGAPMPTIKTYGPLLFLVFKNLISNGIKYNYSGQPEVSIEYEFLEDVHKFSVADNGIGIDKEFRLQIFELFKRLHSRKEFDGSGIGLAVCKKILSRLNGKIWLEEVEKGSKFSFTLPVV